MLSPRVHTYGLSEVLYLPHLPNASETMTRPSPATHPRRHESNNHEVPTRQPRQLLSPRP